MLLSTIAMVKTKMSIYLMIYFTNKDTLLKEPMLGWTVSDPCLIDLIIQFQAGKASIT